MPDVVVINGSPVAVPAALRGDQAAIAAWIAEQSKGEKPKKEK